MLEYEAGGAWNEQTPEKVDEIREVINYRKAIDHAAKRLGELPLCGRLLKEAHGFQELLDITEGREIF